MSDENVRAAVEGTLALLRSTRRSSSETTITPEQYAELCDVIERAWQRWPVGSQRSDPTRHTSEYAREAAMRVLEVLSLVVGT